MPPDRTATARVVVDDKGVGREDEIIQGPIVRQHVCSHGARAAGAAAVHAGPA